MDGDGGLVESDEGSLVMIGLAAAGGVMFFGLLLVVRSQRRTLGVRARARAEIALAAEGRSDLVGASKSPADAPPTSPSQRKPQPLVSSLADEDGPTLSGARGYSPIPQGPSLVGSSPRADTQNPTRTSTQSPPPKASPERSRPRSRRCQHLLFSAEVQRCRGAVRWRRTEV